MIVCQICELGFPPENMQLIHEHHCFICRECIGLVFKPFVFVTDNEIQRRKKKQ